VAEQVKKRKIVPRPFMTRGNNLVHGVMVRLQTEAMKQIDDWARERRVTRAEAIRRLVAAGLQAEKAG
jgi:hypothetical protein